MSIRKTFIAVAISAVCGTSVTAMANPGAGWGGPLPYGRPLVTVDSVLKALDNGAVVNAAVDLSQCTRSDGGAPSQTKGGLRVSPYRIQADGTLSFADSHFTVSTRTGVPAPIMQFLRYTVKPEGNITLTSFIFSIPDYNLTSEASFDCAINKGVSFNAAF